MSLRIEASDLRQVAQMPLEAHGTQAHLVLAVGNFGALKEVVRQATNTVPPNIDIISAVYGAAIARAGAHAQLRGQGRQAREFQALAASTLQALTSIQQ